MSWSTGVRALVLGVTLALLAGACSRTDVPITVRVDYDHDEFATQFIDYFPDRIQVHPGDTVRFVQDWTGEAHTVTLGTRVDEVLAITVPLFEEWGSVPEDQIPPEVLEAYFAAECSLPVLYGCEEQPVEEGTDESAPAETETSTPTDDASSVIDQTIAQPCVVDEGPIPEDGLPCENQQLSPFQGTEAFYNSGFLGFDTEAENVFTLELSDTIEPGEYNFFCAVHGSFQNGTVEVVPTDQPIPDASEVNAETRRELNEIVEPFRQVFAQAQNGNFVFGGDTFSGNFSGLVDDRVEGLLNEFIPKTIETTAGKPITWFIFGPHSISFDVPEYFPIYERLEDGSVRANDELFLPAGGAPEIPESVGGEPVIIDGGTWDGSDFWSSGVLFSDTYVEYTLRITDPGTYRFACLIHPPMVGTVVVEP